MTEAPFETIPAWRIARLRTALREAEQRGSIPDETDDPSTHRALRRRFALGRARTTPTLPGRKPRSTRKGKSFPLRKQAAIWRAILEVRPPGWTQGDKAAFGSIRRAHDAAVAACRILGLTPPRYRTVYVLWHRGRPSAEVAAALREAGHERS